MNYQLRALLLAVTLAAGEFVTAPCAIAQTTDTPEFTSHSTTQPFRPVAPSFGDIVTDLGAALQGGLGMAASANLHPGQTSMFEPVHGSAPKYAGKDVSNPMGAILTAGMMLEHVGLPEAAGAVEAAVVACLEAGECTQDVGGRLGTAATGDAVASRLRA